MTPVEQMRAAVVRRYGPPTAVSVEMVGRPRPRADEVVLRVDAAAVTSGDARMRAGRFPPGFGTLARLGIGLRGPRRQVLGGAVAGVVVEVGAAVTEVAVGDRLCGMTGTRLGGHAELVAAKAAKLAAIPAGVSADDAAGMLFGATTAMHFLRRAGVATGITSPGTTVLVNGAAGAVGSNAVQLAASAGASVTAVTSTRNAQLASALGAERVVDHTQRDVAALASDGLRFDVVFDAVGNISISSGRRLLTPTGTLILAVATLGQNIRSVSSRRPGRRVLAGVAAERRDDFAALLALVADGSLTVVHDRAFTLDEIAAAHAHVDTGRKVGNVIVRP